MIFFLICIGGYIGVSIFINPLTSSFYVQSIGDSMGLKVLGESGIIINKKTKKDINVYATNIPPFINNLAWAGSFPWLCLHPLALPYSVCFITISNFNAIKYLLYHKTRVENGEFDE